ncbi:MAG: hypothetical protein NW215_06200 [Hyphomicrobiales bacterium]|nr:hypothetical protein [Hyphomicrobiales bacterium]
MTYDQIVERLTYYVYNHTELVIWISLITLVVIVVWGAIYSISFRYTIAVIAILTAAALWALDRYYLSTL